MKVAPALVVLLALTACESSVQREERKLGTMTRAGATPDELCTQKRKVADAYLDAGDDANYRERKLTADIDCQAAQLAKTR